MIGKFLKFLSSLGNQKSRLYLEINNLRKTTNGVRKDLIPLEQDELTNISTYRYQGKKGYGVKPVFFTTVFNETIGAYFEKKINKKGDQVVVVYTHEAEFAFVKTDGYTELFVNEAPFGKMNTKGVFYDLHLKAAGKWVDNTAKKTRILQAGAQGFASVNFGERNAITDRMFNDIRFSNEEEKYFLLAFSFYERLQYGSTAK